jgi:hypothetical protein
MEAKLVNRVATSGIQTINLEQYYPKTDIVEIDLKDFLFQGLILREKDFRLALKETVWSQYTGKVIACFCSTDAIIPVWAYMLVGSQAHGHAQEIYTGNKEEFLKQYYHKTISSIDVAQYEDQRIVIKGCSDKPVPPLAYNLLTQRLQGVAKSIMYGEPCSTVPIWKRPRK